MPSGQTTALLLWAFVTQGCEGKRRGREKQQKAGGAGTPAEEREAAREGKEIEEAPLADTMAKQKMQEEDTNYLGSKIC